MRTPAQILVLLAAWVPGLSALAGEDGDLDLIPTAASETSAPSPQADVWRHGRVSLETVAAAQSYRSGLALPPSSGSTATDATVRTSLDLRIQEELTDGLSFTVSDRADGRWRNDIGPPNHRAMVNNLREAYVTLEPAAQTFLEAGRINQRSGIALGFNPTDFFRARSLLAQASADPEALRENRLGTFMVRGQTLWEGGSASVIFAPRLETPASIADQDGGFSPDEGRTNGVDQGEIILAQEIAGFSPQALIYREANRTRFGLNLSHPLGQSVVIYGEWAGGRQMTTAAEAIAFGKRTQALPGAMQDPAFSESRVAMRNDAAVGFSWTWEDKLTVNAEFIEHEGGFSRRDWNAWFAADTAAARAVAWYVRAYAADQQTPISQRQVFLRATWPDAFVRHLEIGALAFVNPDDGSWRGQVSAIWNISERWSMGAYLSASRGDARSDWGSLADDGAVTVQVMRYF